MAEQDPNLSALFDLSALTPTSPTFMNLEDPRYAYMFGFIQADGHLAAGTGRKGRLTVEISVRDIDILREFQQLTPYNSSITERTRSTNFADAHHSATWTLCALEARTTLNGLGLPYGRKSKKITPPRVEFSRRDYLRGVIDADGSVGLTKDGFPFVSLTTASTAVAAYFCHYTKKITGVSRHIKRNARDGIYNVLYVKEAAMDLAAHLYYPGCLALDRKRTSAAALADWVRPAGMRKITDSRRWKPWEDRALLEIDDPEAAGTELNRTASSCRNRLWRLKAGKVPLPPDGPSEL
ncbi:LAGLIDADG family homing endonuclease [Streptomyces sp. NPDC050504]|uniref:LAGLIDADG family homing endonuclease n=1 Tax=Streptomyces sp. NPDC050504 TaxID=3365618 RepID=UPI0037B29923